jgi:glucose 1-dehydrogenase/3-oxoacyl-[acyl-carrier protein] reductase
MPEPARARDRFNERAALVVGGANGIGAATAARLVEEGARVAIADRDKDVGEERATQLGPDAAFLECDVRDVDAIRRVSARAIDLHGGLDYLVQTAGMFTWHGVLRTSPEDWDSVMEVNLRSQVFFIQACADALAERRGAIVNVASIEADILQVSGGEATASYSASKAGVKMMSKAAAHDLAPRGVRVNVVDPGFIRTGFVGNPEVFERPPTETPRLRRILLERWGEPEDIAAAITYLLSDDASYITGTSLVVDGGWTTQ